MVRDQEAATRETLVIVASRELLFGRASPAAVVRKAQTRTSLMFLSFSIALFPPCQASRIEYSEKYQDDSFEYRYVWVVHCDERAQ